MKTYACPGCGDRIGYSAQTRCIKCGVLMHVLDGVIRGGGVMAIWRDGREVWSGTGLEAVELLQKLIHGGIHQVCEQAAEADRIVRQLSTVRYIPSSSEVAVESLKSAVKYVRTYPKT